MQPDSKLREPLQQALGGYRGVLACSSLDAMRLLNSCVFDAFILDYVLPGSSGAHLCRHLRSIHPHTPICFYAAAGTEEQRKRAFNAGASAYICASAGPDVLRGELEQLLGAARRIEIDAAP